MIRIVMTGALLVAMGQTASAAGGVKCTDSLRTALQSHCAAEVPADADNYVNRKAAKQLACYKLETICNHGQPTTPVNWFGNFFSYKDKNVFGGDIEIQDDDGKVIGEVGKDMPMSPPVVFLLFNFALVLVILRKKAVPALQRFAQGRHYDIKDQLDEAAKQKQAATDELNSFDSKLKEVEKEVDEIITGIKSAAESEKARVMSEAQSQADALQRAAESQVAADAQSAQATLRQEVVGKAVDIAKDKLDQKAQQNPAALIDTFIASLEAQAQEVRS